MTEQELQKAREEADKLAKRTMATHLAKTAMHHEKMEEAHTAKAACHAGMAEFHKGSHSKMKKVDVGDEGEGPKGVQEVTANLQEFHKAAEDHHKAMGKEHLKAAKTHGTMAAACHKMSEECDTEEHKKAVDAIKAETPAAEVPVVKTAVVPTLEADVAAAAEALRDTDTYKTAIKSMAQTRIDAELDELRKKTLAPDGVKIAGAEVAKGIRSVARDGEEKNFAFAETSTSPSTAGL
jgi:hypothetical protein